MGFLLDLRNYWSIKVKKYFYTRNIASSKNVVPRKTGVLTQKFGFQWIVNDFIYCYNWIYYCLSFYAMKFEILRLFNFFSVIFHNTCKWNVKWQILDIAFTIQICLFMLTKIYTYLYWCQNTALISHLGRWLIIWILHLMLRWAQLRY